MEPQWNPMIEDQALDRIHRLGQTKDVTTVRYIIRGSFEENIRVIQKRKKDLVQLAFQEGPLKQEDLTYGRLQYLKDLVG
jgi:SWI/SNF-related matrix-associated actin-dependent regulator of chromatin subfamily A3